MLMHSTSMIQYVVLFALLCFHSSSKLRHVLSVLFICLSTRLVLHHCLANNILFTHSLRLMAINMPHEY